MPNRKEFKYFMKTQNKTTAYTIKEISKDTYEIGEFDCASMYLIVGSEKALMIDAGIGIGDIQTVLSQLTDKPITLALSHSHADHVGFVPLFKKVYVNDLDAPVLKLPPDTTSQSMAVRKNYINLIAQRSGKKYNYNLDIDLDEWNVSNTEFVSLKDGDVFDLGNRKVTCYTCPGHTPGSMIFIDNMSRILFLGDALNCLLVIGGIPETGKNISVETVLKNLKRIQNLQPFYDNYYNGHYDYRNCGEPLGADVLPDAITACEALVSGVYQTTLVECPLPLYPPQEMMVVGRTHIVFDENNILDKN